MAETATAMADELLDPIGGFFSSLVEQTQDTSIASSTRILQTTRTLESATTEPNPSVSPASTSTNAASPRATSADTTTFLTSASSEATTVAARTMSSSTVSSATSSAAQGMSSTAAPIASDASSVNAGAIAGGVVGGLAVLALLAFGIIWLLRRPCKSQTDRELRPKSYQGSVISLVAYGKDVHESRSPTSSLWDTASHHDFKSARPAHMTAPSIFVTDDTDTKRLVFELAGSNPAQPTMELDSGQKYRAYCPKPS